jgi:hypothetical protein
MCSTHARIARFGCALALGVLSLCGNLGGNEPSVPAATAQGAVTTIAYGSDALQFGDLRLPSGPGPYPVAVVIHGRMLEQCLRPRLDGRHERCAHRRWRGNMEH